jgi:hypothetical protein
MGWTKVGSGTLNKSKDPSKGAPYYGKCKLTIDGMEREINIGAWVKDGQGGSKFFSLAFSVPEGESQATAKTTAETDEDSSIPF